MDRCTATNLDNVVTSSTVTFQVAEAGKTCRGGVLWIGKSTPAGSRVSMTVLLTLRQSQLIILLFAFRQKDSEHWLESPAAVLRFLSVVILSVGEKG